ncbi:hypothetical protein [Endothiovibrio diazotrophicus]
MIRRMFFLFPDHHHAETAVQELEQAGVEHRRIHAVARPDIDLGQLPRATAAQASDRVRRLERWAWNANQVLFWGAFTAALFAAYYGSAGWMIAMVAVMITTFVLGLLDIRLPTARIGQMSGAIAHGEIVLMVDQPMERVPEIEGRIHRDHPEAAIGGVGWTIEALEKDGDR